MSSPGFDSVLGAAQSGADWALDALFREFQPPLLRYLRAQAPAVAEDLATEVWLALIPKLAAFRGNERGFRGWLFTVARRRLIEHWRQAARRRTDPVPVERLSAHPAADDPAEAGIALVSSQQAVDRLVACLSPDQAEVVLLRVVAGLSAEEVAQVVGTSPGAVRVMQHRALRRLAEKFSEELVTP